MLVGVIHLQVASAGCKHLQVAPRGTDAADNPAQPQQIKMCDEGWGEEAGEERSRCLFPSSLFPLAAPTMLILRALGFGPVGRAQSCPLLAPPPPNADILLKSALQPVP